MIIIFGALKIELIHILRSIHIYKTHQYGKIVIYEGFKRNRPVTIIQTGMGAINARRAADLFKDHYSEYTNRNSMHRRENTEILMIGFCGSADRTIKAGDVIIYSSIKNIEYSDKRGYFLNGSLKLEKNKPGNFLIKDDQLYAAGANVPKVITDPDIKKKLNSYFSIQAIDMESYWIGKAAKEMKLPFSCIRVVSDGAEDILPRYYENPPGAGMAANIVLSFTRSLFSKKEFRSNMNALKNLKKANLKLAKVSEGLTSSIAADTLYDAL